MILVVDDHPDICQALEILLEAAGLRVKCITDPTAVLPAIEALKPHLVILDNHMPRMSGIELLRIIRSRPDLQALPVVGVKDYLVKGKVEFDDLLERVRTITESNSLQEPRAGST
jgi:two-component system response regulator AdeR